MRKDRPESPAPLGWAARHLGDRAIATRRRPIRKLLPSTTCNVAFCAENNARSFSPSPLTSPNVPIRSTGMVESPTTELKTASGISNTASGISDTAKRSGTGLAGLSLRKKWTTECCSSLAGCVMVSLVSTASTIHSSSPSPVTSPTERRLAIPRGVAAANPLASCLISQLLSLPESNRSGNASPSLCTTAR